MNLEMANNPQFPDPGTVMDHSNYCDWVWSSINITNNGPDTTSVNVKDVGDGFVYYNPSIGWNGYVRSNNGTGWIWDDKFDVKTGNGTYNIPNGETYQIAILGYINKTGTITNTVNQIYQDIYSPDPYPTVQCKPECTTSSMIRLNKEFRSTFNGSALRNANYRDWVYSVHPQPTVALMLLTSYTKLLHQDSLLMEHMLVSKDNGLTWVEMMDLTMLEQVVEH